jgi:hypothetical protein
VNHWWKRCGVPSDDSWLSKELIDEAIRKSAELEIFFIAKISFIASAKGDKEDIDHLKNRWPFRDREEINRILEVSPNPRIERFGILYERHTPCSFPS